MKEIQIILNSEVGIKIFLFWAFLTATFWAVCKVHFLLSKTSYTWKYFKEYSIFGAIYGFLLFLGVVLMASFVFIKIGIWWFNL